MNVYIKHRFLLLLPVLLGITFFTFVLMQLPADDTVDMMYKASGAVSETVKAATRAELGLDRPLLVRYLDWLLTACSGDMGRSYISGTPVTALFMAKLPPTLYLTALALLLTACISVPLGIMAALRHNRCSDHLIRCCAFLGNSLPGFFIALLLLYCFALKLNFLPSSAAQGSEVCCCRRWHWQFPCLPSISGTSAVISWRRSTGIMLPALLYAAFPKQLFSAGSSCVLWAVRSLLYSPCRQAHCWAALQSLK